MKRLFDISIALAGLLVSAPVMLVIAIVIAAQRDGPVIYRQLRVGKSSVPFQLLKFRTMRPHQFSGRPQLTVGADPRITPVGRLLRQYKLDELPQLYNVLSGDMSLVGPRPETPEFVKDYPHDLRDIVLSVRPGITDPASIKYRNESELLARSENPLKFYREKILPDKLAIAVQYVGNHSLAGDLMILFNTARAVISPKQEAARDTAGSAKLD